MGGDIWGLITIIGPVLLVVAIVWAMLNNKRSARAEAKTEEATRRMYDAQDRDDKANEVR